MEKQEEQKYSAARKLVNKWELDYAVNHMNPLFGDYEKLCLWIAHRQLENTPAEGQTLKQHLSNESHCCCDTLLVCSIHDKYISEQS